MIFCIKTSFFADINYMKKDMENKFLKPLDEKETMSARFQKVEVKNARKK